MEEDQRYDGPMVLWPEVTAVTGAKQALQALSGSYRMVVATNANQSNPEQVVGALQRVGLDGYFQRVFTYTALGVAKPDPAYYHAIEQALGLGPQQLCMVGDHWWADASGATNAGWQGIWLNRKGEACPALMPNYSAEITSYEDLPAALEGLGLPGLAECRTWLQEQGASLNILLHSELVAGAAYQMAIWLRSAGVNVNPILAQRGGLLHDLAKLSARQLAPHANHGAVAASLLRGQGQPELAEIAARHMIGVPGQEPRTWEEKLVHFSDKLAESSQLVSLETRLEALLERYPHEDGRLRDSWDSLPALQAEIAAAAHIPPAELLPRLQQAVFGIQ